MTTPRPIRVLHSFAKLHMGGVETWLMNIVRQRNPMISFDFYLEKQEGTYVDEARGHGCQIFYAEPLTHFQKILSGVGIFHRFSSLQQVLQTNRYDVFHSHEMEFSGDEVRVAFQANVPVRVAHSHNTQLARGKQGIEMTIRKARFQTVNRKRVLKYATDIIACSSDAGRYFMGKYWNTVPKYRPLFCGVPLGDFLESGGRNRSHVMRERYGIPADAVVIGHVGSMGLQKNPFFIIDVFQDLFHKNDRYWLCMVGDGPLRDSIRQYAEKLGVASRVVMPGICHVPSVMPQVFDALLFPSFYEGMPLVVVEATASGLSTVCSDAITRDVTDCFPERIRTLSLQADISQWADAVETAVAQRMTTEQGCEIVNQSPFSVTSSANSLIRLYQNRLARTDHDA